MERVRYQLPETDGADTCIGKYEAILTALLCNGNKSDVLVDYDHYVSIAYAEGERTRLEPVALSIINNADGTFWEIAQKVAYGITRSEIKTRLQNLGLEVGEIDMVSCGNATTVTVPLGATTSQWKTILARLEMGEGSIGPVMDACDEDD